MPSLRRKLYFFLNLSIVGIVIALLYFMRELFIPLALAALLAFMLNPLVDFLHRRRLPRALAVVVVTIFAFSMLGLLGWVIGRQAAELLRDLPSYKETIQEKITFLQKKSSGGVIDQLEAMKADLEEAYKKNQSKPKNGEPEPLPVTVTNAEETRSEGPMDKLVDQAGIFLGMAATVLVFVIFILLRQQELRNRLMRLAGYRHLTVTTRAVDEISDRVGRYLLTQLMINGIYGALLALGLYCIGLKYVVLWGVLATLFRFIPYVGPWIVAVLPVMLSLAQFPDWTHPLMVMGLIATLELMTNMILEPILYGQSVGVSDFALLVAIVFWTWLWGPVGLVMATPLTVCLVVICKYVPRLEFVDVLMGDKPEMKPYMIFFQRLVAQDEDEAEAFIRQERKEKSLLTIVDETILPAIALAKREASHHRLSAEEERRVYAVADGVMKNFGADEVLDKSAPLKEAENAKKRRENAETEEEEEEAERDAESAEEAVSAADRTAAAEREAPAGPPPDAPLFLGRALAEGADDNALEILAKLLPDSVRFELVTAQRLHAEFLADVEREEPRAVLLSATPPHSHEKARVNVKRLRARFPGIKIYVGRWGVPEDAARADSLLEAGATAVFTKLSEAHEAITALSRETVVAA